MVSDNINFPLRFTQQDNTVKRPGGHIYYFGSDKKEPLQRYLDLSTFIHGYNNTMRKTVNGYMRDAVATIDDMLADLAEDPQIARATYDIARCYERRTFENWPYNLFVMMHSTNMDEIHKQVEDFTKAENVTSYRLLPTIAELKKEPVRHNF